jgi:8-hydroxy-5-deazaflavin:NADPH oxidoreductase
LVAEPVAILGGTGKEGRGLAARWSKAGRTVTIGSREGDRARATASEVAAVSGGSVVGATNGEACRAADIVILATPFEGLEATVVDNADALRGKLVVSAVNPLRFADGRISVREVAEGSAAEMVAARLPQSRVATAFHNVSAVRLAKLDQDPDEDIPVAADSEADREIVVELCQDLGTRGVGVGPLSLARYLEGFTAVLLTINKLYRTQAGIRFTGLP